ncbi:MAG: replication-associated recombination protein A [Deltaproteobacteria bacterium]|nr:replication-associated recombination protein A [Deltaproteobacteria bacterium]
MRPRTLDEVVGQERVIGPGSLLRSALSSGKIPSIVFWGPPGAGKTTLARLVAGSTDSHFEAFSAVLSGVKEIRQIIDQARARLRQTGRRTILFVDEIHRFNKSQQDSFLPHVEAGTIALIGATTENPSFEVNAALLSRCRVVTLDALTEGDIGSIVDRALSDTERGLGEQKIQLHDDARALLVAAADGDARRALNALEVLAGFELPEQDGARVADLAAAKEAVQSKALVYDKSGEEHYNVISAFIKSLRGSDADAALYYLARMIEAGEDPVFIARRMVILASEDIGNADLRALPLAVATMQAVHMIGMPEAQINLAHCATYLACAPKSTDARFTAAKWLSTRTAAARRRDWSSCASCTRKFTARSTASSASIFNTAVPKSRSASPRKAMRKASTSSTGPNRRSASRWRLRKPGPCSSTSA